METLMKRTLFWLLLVGVGLTPVHAKDPAAPATPRIDPNATAATLADQVCSKCHGANGMSTIDNVPNLAGQHVEYLTKQLREFKSHSRADQNAVENMWAISHDLSEKQIGEVAKHFADLKAQVQPVEGKTEQISAGQEIYTGGAMAKGVPACAGCHGADGAGRTMFPRLAGQHRTYLVKQLMVFQRTNERPGAAVMKSVSHELTPENIDNVAAYLQALPHRTSN